MVRGRQGGDTMLTRALWIRGIGNDSHHVYDGQGHLVATTIRAEDGTVIVDAMNENAALRAEVEELTLRRSETIAMCDQLRAEIDRLRGERTDDQLHTDNIELRVENERQLAEREALVKELEKAREQQSHSASCVLALQRQLDVAKGNLPNNHVV